MAGLSGQTDDKCATVLRTRLQQGDAAARAQPDVAAALMACLEAWGKVPKEQLNREVLPFISTAMANGDDDAQIAASGIVWTLAMLRTGENAADLGALTKEIASVPPDRVSRKVKSNVLAALGALRPAVPDDFAPYLLQALADKEPSIVHTAAAVMPRLRTLDAKAQARLIELVKSVPDETVRGGLIQTLGLATSPTPELVAFVVSSIEDERPQVRQQAIQAAFRLEPQITDIAPLERTIGWLTLKDPEGAARVRMLCERLTARLSRRRTPQQQ